MHRKRSRFSRRAVVVAVVGFLAMLGFGIGAYAATTTPPQSDGGLQSNGSYIDCVRNTSTSPQNLLHVVYVPNNGTHGCPAGWTQRNLAAAPAYGVALVNIQRGSAAASTWATLTTALGSPAAMGDQASGTFRATCSDAQAPCKISAQAYATVAGVKVYPRLDIMRQDNNGGPETYCEYADGADNNAASQSVGTSASGVPLGVGGSLDCGTAQVLPASGVVNEIDVPAGHYDISATFYFHK